MTKYLYRIILKNNNGFLTRISWPFENIVINDDKKCVYRYLKFEFMATQADGILLLFLFSPDPLYLRTIIVTAEYIPK